MKPTSAHVVAVVVPVLCLLVACGSGETTLDSSTTEASSPDAAPPQVTVTTVPPVIDVDAADYNFDTDRFRFKLDGSPLRECYIYPAPDPTLSCSVTWPEGTVPAPGAPFDGPPNSIVLTSDGFYPTTGEGGLPGARLLPVQSRLRVGDFWCTAVEGGVECGSSNAGFTFVDGVLDTRGQQVVPPDAAAASTTMTSPPAPTGGGTDGVYADGTEPAALGTTCGAATGHPVVVEVRAGSISCTDALAVMERYNALPRGEHGNANIQQFDGWSCASPTAARAQELGYGQVCHSGDIEIVNPFVGR